MSTHYQYRWSTGCETALIEGPGLGHGMEVTDMQDRELAATCKRMDLAYEAGIAEGADLNLAVQELAEAHTEEPPEKSTSSYTFTPPKAWALALHPQLHEHLEYSRGLGKTVQVRLKYLEQVMVRSLFHEVTGELPTDEAMKPRITVVHYPDKRYAYVLDHGRLGATDTGALLLLCEGFEFNSLPDRNVLRTNFRSPLFVK